MWERKISFILFLSLNIHISSCPLYLSASVSLHLSFCHSLSHSAMSSFHASSSQSPLLLTPHPSSSSPCNFHFLRRHLWHVFQKINLIGESACQSIFPAREGERAGVWVSVQTSAGRLSRFPSHSSTEST